MSALRKISGGVCAPAGFVASAVACGIKTGTATRDDLALIASRHETVAAATFTTNRVKAAPVIVSGENLRGRDTRAVILNSGNANACTGNQGLADARRMTSAAASALGLLDAQVLVCSTGRIGIPLPIDRIESAIPELVRSLHRKGSESAARAIMTSDTVPKEAAVSVSVGERTFRIGGLAKGAGMIDPNMATMLAVVTTDAPVPKAVLRSALKDAVGLSFNRITVDGDMSTNDTVLIFANGAAGGDPIAEGTPEAAAFRSGVESVCRTLARKIVEDGEGTTKVIEVLVRGAARLSHARTAAEAVANSTLTKCAWAGGDPNWGRILDAVGYSGVKIHPEKVDIFYENLPVALGGAPPSTPAESLRAIAARDAFRVTIDLHMGDAAYEVLTTDLTEEYVRLNLGE